jgi:RNA polymerase sigma-70 factor, ECF subfamily
VTVAESDAALVERCLAGDEGAVRALVGRYQGLVFALCYRMLSHREDAEDVAQEAFVRAIRNLHRWDRERPLRPWLLTIAANRCRTALQRRARQPVPTEFLSHVPDGTPPPGDVAEEIQLALETLRDDYRTCFVLFHQQELSCAQIGEVMGCPEGTVKTWLHRARRALAECLQRRGVVPHASYELHRI